jgi:hypothetical protein
MPYRQLVSLGALPSDCHVAAPSQKLPGPMRSEGNPCGDVGVSPPHGSEHSPCCDVHHMHVATIISKCQVLAPAVDSDLQCSHQAA